MIKKELGETVGKGQVHRVRSPRTSGEVSALIAVTGCLSGIAIYSMSLETARAVASRMIGEPVTEFDDLPQSAIAELANVITGRQGFGWSATDTPPTCHGRRCLSAPGVRSLPST